MGKDTWPGTRSHWMAVILAGALASAPTGTLSPDSFNPAAIAGQAVQQESDQTLAFNLFLNNRDKESPFSNTAAGMNRHPHELIMVATGYCACAVCCGRWADGYTATGRRAAPGLVAVDPLVIPLHSRLEIEGYGLAIAADTGAAIKGNRIDLFFTTHREALAYGKRRVRVLILQ